MSRNVLTSGASYTNIVTASSDTNVVLNNGDGDIILTAADELKLEASRMSIKLGTAQAGQVLTTDGTRCSWQSPPKQDLQDVTAQGSTTNNNLVVSKDGKSATYKNDSMIFNNAMNLGATSIKLKAESSIWLDGDLLDSNGASGSSGDVLTKVGNGHEWLSPEGAVASGLFDTSTVSIGSTDATTTINLGNSLSNLQLSGKLNGGGTSGQVLSSTGTGVQWVTPPDVTGTTTLAIGANSATTGIVLGKTGQTITCPANLSVQGTLRLNSSLLDISGNTGSSAQVLSSTGSGVKWITPTAPDVTGTTTLAIGGNSATTGIVLGKTGLTITCPSNLIVQGTLSLNSSLFDISGNTGTSGQVLSSTGTGVKWITNTSSSTGLDATQVNIGTTSATTSIKIGRELMTAEVNSRLWVRNLLLDADGNSGLPNQILTANNSNVKWVTPPDVLGTTTLSVGTNINTSAITLGRNGQMVTCNSELYVYGGLRALNGPGTSGTVLGRTATGVEWVSENAPLHTASVLIGTTTSTTSVTLGRTGQTVTCNSQLRVDGGLYASNGLGTSGQVLTSTVNGVQWTTPSSSSGGLDGASVNIGTTSSTTSMTIGRTGLNVSVPSNLALLGQIKDNNNQTGTAGMVLRSNSNSKLEWTLPVPSYVPHIITTTAAYSVIDGYFINSNGTMCNMVYIPSSAGNAASRVYNLPFPSQGNVVLPCGYPMYFTNLSGADWKVSCGLTAKILTKTTTGQGSAPSFVMVPSGTINLPFIFYGSCDNGNSVVSILWACSI